MSDFVRYLLSPAGLHLPNVRDGHADTAKYSGAGLSDLETRGEDGVSASNGDLGVRLTASAEGLANAHDLLECCCHARPPVMTPPSCRGSRRRSTRPIV